MIDSSQPEEALAARVAAENMRIWSEAAGMLTPVISGHGFAVLSKRSLPPLVEYGGLASGQPKLEPI